ncbi:unnamed protein product [Dibothriocephalus latus]|uniref:Uncharacterized protein n=1 Tax=Dibothriocephalus latus TaxID=60516 RepID=A0A3P7LK33_DIBLA|nr:unnamed protein product [Dibothriocephalus latus]
MSLWEPRVPTRLHGGQGLLHQISLRWIYLSSSVFLMTEQFLPTMLLLLLLAAGIEAHPAGLRIQQGLLASQDESFWVSAFKKYGLQLLQFCLNS